MRKMFDLSNKVVVITGGAGFLGQQHAEAISEHGGIPIILDIDTEALIESKRKREDWPIYTCNILNRKSLERVLDNILVRYGRIDVLINNAANNPTVDKDGDASNFGELENFPIDVWNNDINVNLTGALLCTQVFGGHMKKNGGSIINIGSELGIISPDPRMYNIPKPVSYTVSKAALIGLTKYTAIHWAPYNIRCNCVAFGSAYNNQTDELVEKLKEAIPLGRLARKDEYKGMIVFLASDESSFLTGETIVMDGGRSKW